MEKTRFAAYAWGVLGLNLIVVLWGAFVRATGSGAGCGRHWPLCNGEVVPRSAKLETVIELTHRLTSGLALVAVLVMLVWAFRAYSRGHAVRLGATLSLVFIVVEALLGAGLVLLELVAMNDSVARAYWMVAHLLNTFILLGVLALTAWWASGSPAVRLRGAGTVGWALAGAIVGFLAVGATGAIAALGDTLFPAESLAQGLRDSFSPESHPLIRLRKLHPILAIAAGAATVLAARFVARRRPSTPTHRTAAAVSALFALQILAGAVNVVLLAPVWLQLLHLLLADLLWIALVLLTASALAVPSPSRQRSASAPPAPDPARA
jgi:cytochrome c oxidase assembly protein subunit 15